MYKPYIYEMCVVLILYITYTGGYNGGYKPTNITGDVRNPMR